MALPLFITFCCIFVSSMSPSLTAATTKDRLSATVCLRDGQTLVSSNQVFEFGFFSLGNSTNRYIGIWYKNLPLTVVWVANRNTPITGDLAHIMVTKGGSLVISNGTDCVRHVDHIRSPKNPVLQLLDSGNLVVSDNGGNHSEGYLWQSFHYPCNTLLPGMKLGWNLKTGFNRFVTSWKSCDDPASGDFTFSLETPETPQLVLRKGTLKQYRWGPWDGVGFSGSSELKANPVFQPTFVSNASERYYIFTVTDKSLLLRFLLSSQGSIQFLKWRNSTKEWVTLGTIEKDRCNRYAVCGPYASCYTNDPECRCLKGFEPKSPKDWAWMDWSGGCTRKLKLDCGDGEGFVKFEGMKLPDHAQLLGNRTLSPEECEVECLKNCSCMAYSNINVHDNSSDCVVWFDNLTDIRNLPINGEEIYIRMARAELESIAEAKRKMQTEKVSIIIMSIVSGLFLFAVGCYIFLSVREMRRALSVKGASQDVTENPEEDLELPLFDMLTISAATNQFSEENKIGRGGFGFVYKGVFPNGEEIAVKRLSTTSAQGLQEFKNEVLLVANLQHRNLVKLLGYCIQRNDRMIVYEYQPNKSLDYFLFDQTRNNLLNWPKRLNIIFGIARGLLYLHEDSRLRIVHRDLKASNILLDDNMDPKISDFGTARVFGGDQTEEITKRVIGTYGYMSPEYALSGQFSMKSDVFSFGVLLLEIISGKKNWGFSHPDHDLNLIGHAWKLWNEGTPLELLDHLMEGSFYANEVIKCIQVGLLCVQQLADDRPTMSSVIHMLHSESSIIPLPKEPGFFTGNNSSLNLPNPDTVNQVTITELDPR